MARFLIILLVLFGLPGTSSALEITFMPNAQIEDSVIKLGDVATFDEQTPIASALATQTVGQAPNPGNTLILRSQNIKQYLLSNRPSIGDGIDWNGSPTVKVMRQGVVIGAEKIQSIIADYISSNSKNLPKADIRFNPDPLPTPFTIPKGDLTHEVIPSNAGILGSSSISIIFKVDNNVVKNISIRGKLEALAKIVVAAEPLKKGLILKPQHLKNAVVDINEIPNPEIDTKQLLGMQLTKNINTGGPVVAASVEAVPVVRRGQKVKIIAESGTLQLTATGLAQSDGKIDQMIKVQNIQSNKIVFARVASPGIVEVVL